ncbi:MAG: DUF4149 domain-containing protein [Deltaproteobacteria bacterium]
MLGYLETFTLVFALALLVGGGSFWAFIAAPAVFSISPSRDLAGRMATAMLGRFDRIGQGCLLAIGGIELLRVTERATQTELLRAALALGMGTLALYSALVVRPAIARLRASLPEDLPDDHEGRRSLGRLHGQAYACLLGELLSGAFLLALLLLPAA